MLDECKVHGSVTFCFMLVKGFQQIPGRRCIQEHTKQKCKCRANYQFSAQRPNRKSHANPSGHKQKVRGGRGASSSSPYHAYARSIARPQEVRAQTPWGTGCAYTKMNATRLIVDAVLLAQAHPGFRPILMY